MVYMYKMNIGLLVQHAKGYFRTLCYRITAARRYRRLYVHAARRFYMVHILGMYSLVHRIPPDVILTLYRSDDNMQCAEPTHGFSIEENVFFPFILLSK